MLKWICPQAHKYHILLTLMCLKPDVKYGIPISFIMAFYVNNQYGASSVVFYVETEVFHRVLMKEEAKKFQTRFSTVWGM